MELLKIDVDWEEIVRVSKQCNTSIPNAIFLVLSHNILEMVGSKITIDSKRKGDKLSVTVKVPDRLDAILKMQDKLNSKVGLGQKRALEMSDEDRMAWIRRYCEALIVETAEVLEEAGFKWWKTKDYDYDKLKEEIIDVGHFWLSLCLLAGMNAEEVYNVYMRKNQKNFVRKDWDANKGDSDNEG